MSGLAIKILTVAAVSAGTFLALALAYSFAKFEGLMRRAHDPKATPLSPRENLLLLLARRLGIGSEFQGAFTVLLVDFPAAHQMDGGIDRLAATLRAAVRHSDDVLAMDDHTIAAALQVPAARVPQVLARWRKRMEADLPGLAGAAPPRIGAARFPEDGDYVRAVVEAAEAALEEEKRSPSAPWTPRVPEHPGTGKEASVSPQKEEALSPAESAVLDPLTGILRSEKIGIAARKFIARARRNGRPVAVLYLDVDRLEDINRRFGREVGDAVLKNLSDILQTCLRESDLLGRFGGDDFLVLAECAPGDGARVADRIIGRVREAVIPAGMSRLRYTVAVGIAGMPEHGQSARVVMEAAEAALGAARRTGQNVAVVYHQEMESIPARRGHGGDVF